ncbi:hypothetical protein [Streptomyces sp. CLCI03]
MQGGRADTSRTLPTSVPRPDLLRIRAWTTEGYAYRAELYALAPAPMISLRPVLDEDPGLPDTWWKEMKAALDALAEVPPPGDREAVREEYLRRVIPEFTGHQVDDVTRSTAHGDLHHGDVTRGPHILDWEGWGRAPYGYDAATLPVGPVGPNGPNGGAAMAILRSGVKVRATSGRWSELGGIDCQWQSQHSEQGCLFRGGPMAFRAVHAEWGTVFAHLPDLGCGQAWESVWKGTARRPAAAGHLRPRRTAAPRPCAGPGGRVPAVRAGKCTRRPGRAV